MSVLLIATGLACAIVLVSEIAIRVISKSGGQDDSSSPDTQELPDNGSSDSLLYSLTTKASLTATTALALFVATIVGLRTLSIQQSRAIYGIQIPNPLWWDSVDWIVYSAAICVLVCLGGSVWLLVRKHRDTTADGVEAGTKTIRPQVIVATILIFGAGMLYACTDILAEEDSHPIIVKVSDEDVAKMAKVLTFDKFSMVTGLGDSRSTDTSTATDSLAGISATFMIDTQLVGSEQMVCWRWQSLLAHDGEPSIDSGCFSASPSCAIRTRLAYELCEKLGSLPDRILFDPDQERVSEACDAIMDGWMSLNGKSNTSITEALGHFERAIKVDSNVVSAYVYAAYCCNIILDRYFPSHETTECDNASALQSYRRSTEQYEKKLNDYIAEVLKRNQHSNNYVVEKVKADRKINLGESELSNARVLELSGSHLTDLEPHYRRAESHFLSSISHYRAALTLSPDNAYIKFNLGTCYMGLFRVATLLKNYSSAKKYLQLATIATAEAIDKSSSASRVRLAWLSYYGYKYTRPDDHHLIDSAYVTTVEIINSPDSAQNSQDFKGWLFEARMLKAAISLHRYNETQSRRNLIDALIDIQEADKLDIKNVCILLQFSREYETLANILEDQGLNSIDELLLNLQTQVHLSIPGRRLAEMPTS